MKTKNCFVVMPFGGDLEKVYNEAILPALKSINCKSIRSDKQLEPIIIEGIHLGIKNSNVCIADLTGFNKNVLYEVGISHSSKTPTVLITQDNPENLPFDLKHYRVITYKLDELVKLQEKISKVVKNLLELEKIPFQIIQEMLIPKSLESNNFHPYIIACSPLSWRTARQTGGGYKKIKNTYGDHIGVRGIIQAFGLIKGLDTLPELINSGDFAKETVLEKANIYCIASPKANHWTKILLQEFCENKSPKFSFRPDINSSDLRDVHINIHMGNDRYLPPGWDDSLDRYKHDFGLIVRGPHPRISDCMIMILAGRGSIGTEAACRAVTEPTFIKKVKNQLMLCGDTDLNKHDQAFWAIVSLKASNETNRDVDINSFEVIAARPFKESSMTK